MACGFLCHPRQPPRKALVRPTREKIVAATLGTVLSAHTLHTCPEVRGDVRSAAPTPLLQRAIGAALSGATAAVLDPSPVGVPDASTTRRGERMAMRQGQATAPIG